MEQKKQVIRSFKDLDVYERSYSAMLIVFKDVLPMIPPEEKDDLGSQIRRSSKAIPRLIAEGYSKRHQKRGFQKYLYDALAESNETIVSLCQVRDLYCEEVETKVLEECVRHYDIISKQIYRLAKVWDENVKN